MIDKPVYIAAALVTGTLAVAGGVLLFVRRRFAKADPTLEELVAPLRTPEQTKTHERFEEIYQHYADKQAQTI